MKRTILPLGLAVLTAMDASAATNLMTYQGRLKESGAPVTGTRQVNIFLCNALTGGVCTPTGEQAVAVTNALFRTTFTVPGGIDLESGSWFLEVRLGAGGTTTLVPREELTASPYAVMATSATTVPASGVRSGTLGAGVNLAGNAATATALAANPANCAAGTVPLGVAASGAGEGCYDVATQAELDVHTAGTSVHGATNLNTASRIVIRDASGNFSAGTITANLTGNASGTASSLAANGANCAAGTVPLGVDDFGSAESCLDVGTQVELDAHINATSAHTATSANTASRIVMRDAAGNFSAGVVTVTKIVGSGGASIGPCGTIPAITGVDTGGRITVGTGNPGACTVTFNSAFSVAPACTVTATDTALNYGVTTTGTSLTITSSGDMSSKALHYICVGL